MAKGSTKRGGRKTVENEVVARPQSTARDDETQEKISSESAREVEQNESKDGPERTVRSRRQIDAQEKLISQLSDLSLTSKKKKKIYRERNEEEEVVERFTKLELQGPDEDDEEDVVEKRIPDEEDQTDLRRTRRTSKKNSSYSDEDEEENEEDSTTGRDEGDDTEDFDSLDDFIVSDNESLSLYEDSEYEDEKDSDEEGGGERK